MANHPTAGVRMPAGCTCVRRAAEQLQCTERHVRRYIRDGKLHAQRIGRRYWAVDRAAIETLALRRAR
jgi:excisionase family DNA binding protein